VRGIERKKIFKDDADRDWFLERLGVILGDTNTTCLAWALVPNHFHLLLRSGTMSVSSVMRRLLTGYAIHFNQRYRRSGHLFQNRYKSILCQENTYLLELVRYIHLNPLRAKLVPGYNALENHPFSGHSAILGKVAREWQDTQSVLSLYGTNVKSARSQYSQYVQDGIAVGRRSDLTGGGLIRSLGGWQAVRELRNGKAYQKGDERILGDGAFVEKTLQESEEQMGKRLVLKAQGMDFNKVMERVAALLEISASDVMLKGKKRQTVTARSLLCFWASAELGMSQASLARRLELSQAAVSAAVERGRKVATESSYALLAE
jgi:REP element-mobilizing transposase RayT